MLVFFFFSYGTFAKDFFAPLNKKITQFITTLYNDTVVPTSTPVLSPTNIPSVKPNPSNTVLASPSPKKAVVSCSRINIREGEFTSNKCYVAADYRDLNYYLQRFNSSIFSLESAEGTIGITCNCRVAQECEFFKDSCSKAKQQKSNAESDIAKYRAIIRGLISKGK